MGLVLVVVAGLTFIMTWSASAATARGAGCSAQVDRAVNALTSGGTIDVAHATKLQSCIRSQPGQTADSLALGLTDSPTTTQNAAAPATVLAVFWTPLADESGRPLCLNFNSDGTISGQNVLTAVEGGYLGTPGVFTLLAFTLFVPGGSFDFAGLSIGPLLLAVPTEPVPIPFFPGLQVPSC
jgi:hypothetical protein